MRTSRRRSSVLGFWPHRAAVCQACCNSPRVVRGGDCQRSHWPRPSMLRRVHATTCKPSPGDAEPRRKIRRARPSQSGFWIMPGMWGCCVKASRSAPHCASPACSTSTSSECWCIRVCARVMPSNPRQPMTVISAIRPMAISSSIKVKPRWPGACRRGQCTIAAPPRWKAATPGRRPFAPAHRPAGNWGWA